MKQTQKTSNDLKGDMPMRPDKPLGWTRRLFSASALSLALGSSVGLATLSHDTQAASARDNTVAIAIEANMARLDPHASTTWNTFRVLMHIFEGFVAEDLTIKDVEQPPIVPALAESWKISEDGLTYTFNLRKGVKFHDGTAFNAEAVKFNMDRMLDKDFKYYQAVAAGLMRWMWQDLDSYKVIDEHTFEIKLKSPNSEFLRRLAMGGSGTPRFISPASIEKGGNDSVETNPIGTGPFKFEKRTVGEATTLLANKDYWDAERLPEIERLIFRPISEVATRELALMSGEVDMISSPSPDSIDRLKAQGLKIESSPVSTLYMMWVNMKEKPLQDVRVRQAICMALDREGMAKFHRNGYAQPAYSVLNFGGPGYDPGFRDCQYDPEKAKALLAEAGYPDGFKTRMDWTMGGGGDVNTVGDAEWIQRNLSKIGIEASIESFDNGTYWDMLGSGIREGTGFMSVSWGETSFFWLDQVIASDAIPPNGFNAGYYDNPKIDELLAQARSAKNEDAMVEHLHEIQQTIADDMAFIPYYTPIAIYAMRPNVSGFVLAPQHWHDYTGLKKN
ncbi:ABC transporter substrate-binding protein [Allohahella marinimesophila]|uniref:ABC transporter substrate-binding protein n=1 Tax=Allohahella marinimesophila TaxID=1054972 RepID=A0ABP7NV17_9GAMM